MSLLKTLDRIPPFLAIAIGTQVHGLTFPEIARQANISRRTITRLNDSDSWAGVKAGTIERVTEICQVDLLSPNLALDLLRDSQGTEKKFDALPSAQRVKVFEMFDRLKERLSRRPVVD